jgi:hypothetical protein
VRGIQKQTSAVWVLQQPLKCKQPGQEQPTHDTFLRFFFAPAPFKDERNICTE